MEDRAVSLNRRLHEVDLLLVGQIVTIRYDSAKPL